MADAILDAARLPARDAIAYFRGKENVPTSHWTDLWHEAHARGFMVAGAAADGLLKDLRAGVDKIVAGELTGAQWRKTFDQIVATHGWEHTGAPGWRADIIYDTNMSTAFAAGRYRQMTTPEALELYPYWRYTHHTCRHPRPQHVAWDGLILRADDPWWETHYPPNGWRCHCTVEVVSEAKLSRNGWSVSSTPAIEMRAWTNPRTGEVHQVPVGIDPGFGYNPGVAWKTNEDLRAGRTLSGLRPAEDAGPATVRPAVHPMAPIAGPVPEVSKPIALPDAVRRRAQAEAARAQAETPRGNVEVGTMSEAAAQALGAGSRHVLMSEDLVRKQRGETDRSAGHQDISADDYATLPDVLAQPHVLAQDRDKKIAFFRKDGSVFRAVVKTTRDGSENFLLSFHRLGAKSLRRALKRMSILDGSVEDLLAGDEDSAEEN